SAVRFLSARSLLFLRRAQVFPKGSSGTFSRREPRVKLEELFPDRGHDLGGSDGFIAGDERQAKAPCLRDDEPVEEIADRREGVSGDHGLGGERKQAIVGTTLHSGEIGES